MISRVCVSPRDTDCTQCSGIIWRGDRYELIQIFANGTITTYKYCDRCTRNV